jgi:ribonuclease HIII
MGTLVRKIGAAEGRGLRDRLERDGFRLREEQHAHYAATGPGVTVVHYRSGKLVVQGKGAEDFAATYLGLGGDAGDESSRGADGVTEPIIGTDESGKGDYFGPLVVAAMLVRPEDAAVLREIGVRDSKEVGDAEALALAAQIEDAWPGKSAVVCVGPRRYNELHAQFGGNLNRLLAWGHAQAVEDVLRTTPCGRVLADQFGNERLVRDALAKKKIEVALEQRPRAESHPAVAAASILARARFLRELRRLGDEFGVRLPKGAGSPVDAVARRIFAERGLEGLAQVAKMHFRTTQKARGTTP